MVKRYTMTQTESGFLRASKHLSDISKNSRPNFIHQFWELILENKHSVLNKQPVLFCEEIIYFLKRSETEEPNTLKEISIYRSLKEITFHVHNDIITGKSKFKREHQNTSPMCRKRILLIFTDYV